MCLAHFQGNLKRKSINFSVAIAHNIAGYDTHQKCTTINKRSSNNFSVIRRICEKKTCFTFSVAVICFVDKTGVTKNVYEDMPFLDSFKVMQQTREKQFFSLKEKITHFESQFSMQKTALQIDLLKMNCVHPYTNMETSENFCEKKIIAKTGLDKHTKIRNVAISDGDLNNANLVFQQFDCKMFGDYNIHLRTDVLIPASVFEEFC